MFAATVCEKADSGHHEGNDVFDRLMDRFIFAPLEVMSEANNDIGATAQRGRDRVSSQARNARVLGQMVVGFGVKEVERRLKDFGVFSVAQETSNEPDAPATPNKEPSPYYVDPGSIDHLIANYDDLSASQVIRLLDNFTLEELDAIEHYESLTRRRTTIMNRILQVATKDEPES